MWSTQYLQQAALQAIFDALLCRLDVWNVDDVDIERAAIGRDGDTERTGRHGYQAVEQDDFKVGSRVEGKGDNAWAQGSLISKQRPHDSQGRRNQLAEVIEPKQD